MKGFALSSLVPEAPITSAIATALLQQLRRVEAMWVKQLTDPQSANARVWGCVAEVALEWSATIGEVAPGDFAVVQLVTALPPGTPDNIIAYHTEDDLGRPLCLISYVNAGVDWPSACSHELAECRVDANCSATAKAPDGRTFALEVCDTAEGSDYEEAGVKVSNAVGPAYFCLAPGPLDIAGVMSEPFQILPTGYAVVDGSDIFGAMVPQTKKDHVLSSHGRPGIRRGKR